MLCLARQHLRSKCAAIQMYGSRSAKQEWRVRASYQFARSRSRLRRSSRPFSNISHLQNEGPMKKDKFPAILLPIIFFFSGAYILQDTVIRPGAYAEEWILIGAVLSACFLAAIGWFFKLLGDARSIHRRMRRH
jgi:hypothetical protein